MLNEKEQATPDVAAGLVKIEATDDETQQALALADLAPLMREAADMRRALDIARALENNQARAKALVSLAPFITEDLLPTALQVAQSIQDEEQKTVAQSAIVQRLQSSDNKIRRYAKSAANAVTGPWLPILLSFLVAGAITGVLGWFIWKLMPSLWNWGYGEFSWRSLVAWVPVLYLGIAPLIGLALFPILLEFWGEYGAIRKQVASARVAQRRIERELLKDDPQKLVLIISYSRQVLGEYYGIAMSQAQRSFRYCLIAMWLGFFVLMIGVLDNIISIRPLIAEALGMPASSTTKTTEAAISPNDLVLITGVVIEFIAAAFLWVYRFSIQQQTYYYRRQLSLHNALLAQRLSETMTTSKDEAVKMIVQQLLEDSTLQQIERPNTSGLGRFFKNKQKNTASE